MVRKNDIANDGKVFAAYYLHKGLENASFQWQCIRICALSVHVEILTNIRASNLNAHNSVIPSG